MSQTYYTDLTRAVGQYLALTSPGHLLLGLPYYGRAWSTVSNAPNAATLPQNDQNGYSVAAPYDVAAGLADTNGRQWDATETSAWTAYQKQNCDTCPNVWRELYYDDAQSLAAKYQLVLSDKLRGTGMWALGYDGTRPELTALLHQVFGAAPPLPPTGAVSVTATGSPGNPRQRLLAERGRRRRHREPLLVGVRADDGHDRGPDGDHRRSGARRSRHRRAA